MERDRVNNCCHMCEKRTMVCHSTCNDYKALMEQKAAEKAARKRELELECYFALKGAKINQAKILYKKRQGDR